MKAFLKPLTAEEEGEYLQRHLNGDLQAREVLIERNMRLVAHVIKKYNFAEKDADELLSIGCVGLIKAVNTYDPSRSRVPRLAIYAGKCIENEILMHLRVEKKLSREVSLYEPIGKDKEGNEINLIDVIESPDEDVVGKLQTREDITKLRTVMQTELTPRELDIMRMRYGIGMGREYTQKEIAKKYGISRSYVSRIEKKALQKLQDCFATERGVTQKSVEAEIGEPGEAIKST